jgi:hypothetical protein
MIFPPRLRQKTIFLLTFNGRKIFPPLESQEYLLNLKEPRDELPLGPKCYSIDCTCAIPFNLTEEVAPSCLSQGMIFPLSLSQRLQDLLSDASSWLSQASCWLVNVNSNKISGQEDAIPFC